MHSGFETKIEASHYNAEQMKGCHFSKSKGRIIIFRILSNKDAMW